MGTNCAPLVADLLLCFMTSLSDDNQADMSEAFISTSRCLDYLLNIHYPYFEGMVIQMYPTELQLNKANASNTNGSFWGLRLSVSNVFVVFYSSKIYD